MAKPVITISRAQLPGVALDLVTLMREDGFHPDALVGIARGGLEVALALTPDEHLPVVSCSTRRASTSHKQRLDVSRVLRRLPYSVTNTVRRVEDAVAARHPSLAQVVGGDQLESEVAGIAEDAARQGWKQLAVVDDAVDTGSTLAVVTDALKRHLRAGTEVRTAVVTITREAQALTRRPEYALHAMTLCRFPWSDDYHGAS